jgi:hypothetical protein
VLLSILADTSRDARVTTRVAIHVRPAASTAANTATVTIFDCVGDDGDGSAHYDQLEIHPQHVELLVYGSNLVWTPGLPPESSV